MCRISSWCIISDVFLFTVALAVDKYLGFWVVWRSYLFKCFVSSGFCSHDIGDVTSQPFSVYKCRLLDPRFKSHCTLKHLKCLQLVVDDRIFGLYQFRQQRYSVLDQMTSFLSDYSFIQIMKEPWRVHVYMLRKFVFVSLHIVIFKIVSY